MVGVDEFGDGAFELQFARAAAPAGFDVPLHAFGASWVEFTVNRPYDFLVRGMRVWCVHRITQLYVGHLRRILLS